MERREGNGQVKEERENGGKELVKYFSNHVPVCCLTHTPPALQYYYVCWCDGVARKNCTESKGKKRAQRELRKINGVCISRMYATHASDRSVRVKYVTSHTN